MTIISRYNLEIICTDCNKRLIIELPMEGNGFFKLHNNHHCTMNFKDTLVIRPMFTYIRNNFGYKELTGVEIGVNEGINAFIVLNSLNIKKLYLIDPYLHYDEYDDSDYKYGEPNSIYKIAKDNLQSFENEVELIKEKSEDAVDKIPNNLDFVYIDGNHSYDYVMRDIKLFYPKVRKGGIIGGHDFGESCPDVCRAVLDFVKENNIENNDYHDFRIKRNDWWFKK